MEHEFMTAKQIAELLQCSVAHIHRQAANGKIPAPVIFGYLKRWRSADFADKTDTVEHISAPLSRVIAELKKAEK